MYGVVRQRSDIREIFPSSPIGRNRAPRIPRASRFWQADDDDDGGGVCKCTCPVLKLQIAFLTTSSTDITVRSKEADLAFDEDLDVFRNGCQAAQLGKRITNQWAAWE